MDSRPRSVTVARWFGTLEQMEVGELEDRIKRLEE
jgi:hypothetical protein